MTTRSVSRCDGRAVTAEAVVEARGDHIHVLADPVVNKSGRNSGTGERIVGIAHEQMIVLNTERPVWCEAVLKSNTDSAAPAGRACRGQFSAENVLQDAKTIARHRRAALYVKQRLIPGVADLAGKETDAIGFGTRGEQRIDHADALAAEIRPIALGFHAKHPLTGLPTITDLATDKAP